VSEELRGLTPAEALRELAAWATDRPHWLQVALSRLQVATPIDSDVLEELTELCVATADGPESAADTGDTDADATSTSEGSDAESGIAAAPAVTLRWIADVENVNALQTGERLKFEPNGLTIIFGHNGTGKSGYSRILKDACKARSTEPQILPNVYAETEGGRPKARIRYMVDGNIHDCYWSFGSPHDNALDEISVFDAHCAVGHVESPSGPSFTPKAIRLLQQLASICMEVEARLKRRRAALVASQAPAVSNPKCKPETSVGRSVEALSYTSSPQSFEKLASISPAEAARATELRRQMADDPRTAARALKNRTDRLSSAISEVREFLSALTDEQLAAAAAAVNDASSKREAAQLAATTLFRTAPLPYVGSDTWLALWQAARTYSEAAAYPSDVFPYVADGAKCVLCQQDLGADAQRRLASFEEYVQAATAVAAGAAEEIADAAVDALDDAKLASTREAEIAASLSDEWERPDLAQALRELITAARERQAAALTQLRDRKAVRVNALPAGAVDDLNRLVTESRSLIERLVAAAESPERTALQSELDELVDRIWLAEVLDDLKAEISRLKSVDRIDRALRCTSTRAISLKSSAFADRLLTPQLRERFEEEIRAFGLSGVAVEFSRTDSQRGMPQFEVRLANAKEGTTVGNILSEGEHRCVALAAFLAELAVSDSKSAIIFDDPVSSLDHEYRQAVAARLAEEAKSRQVVVFTHDLVFLTELSVAAHSLRITHSYRTIDRTAEATGLCSNDVPMRYLPVLDGVSGLRRYVQKTRCAFDRRGWGAWCRPAESSLQDLRKLWEAAVEEALAPVYRRLSYRMDTKGLAKVSVLTSVDCAIMREGYEWCNPEMHRQAVCSVGPPATPDELLRRIGALEQWITGVLARQDAISP